MEASIVAAAMESWFTVFSWPNILYPIAGTLLSMIFSIIPGLSGVTLMALAIPFTFNWSPVSVLLIFGAFVGGATFMGSVTAILFNIPGRNSSAATMLDGYPMAQQGKAKTAIGCSATASALGSSVGVLLLLLFIPFMRSAILAFGPAELLAMAIWGLTTIIVLARGNLVKSFSAAGIGLLLSFIGYDPRTAELRYTVGSLYLREGLSLVPTFLGLFAMAEIIHLMVTNRATISGKACPQELSGSVLEGVWSCCHHFGLLLRCSVIGTVVGMIPSIGASVASFIAYGHAKQTAGNKEKTFGHGDIRGVLAPEAANDAKDGGALLPTLALGIPGSVGTAMLLAVLNLHGITTGKELLGENLQMAFILIWSMFFSNWMTSLLGIVVINPLVRLTTIRTQLLLPVILGLVTTGAYVFRGRFEDILVVCIFGFIGYGMKHFNWPRIPVLIAFVLGPLFENNFLITLKLHDLGVINFWQRPIALGLIILTIASTLMAYLPSKHGRNERETPND